MGFYLSAALLLPRLSWFSLISFFKMTSKQRFVLCTNNQISSCLYCFIHSVKCALLDSMWWVCVCEQHCSSPDQERGNSVWDLLYYSPLCLSRRHSHKAFVCLCFKKCSDMREMESDIKSKSIKGWEMEWDEKERANGCAVILVVLVGKFSVWTESDEAGQKPPGWISEIKVPRSLLSHHIPCYQGGIHLLTQKDGATESAGGNWQKMESKSLSGGFVGTESGWTLWGPVVRRTDDISKRDTQKRIYCMYIDLYESALSFLFRRKDIVITQILLEKIKRTNEHV